MFGFLRHSYCSRLFDNFGNEYPANGVTLANCQSEKNCKKDLISGIRTKAMLTFGGMANDATYAAVVELTYDSRSSAARNEFRVKFHNIPFK